MRINQTFWSSPFFLRILCIRNSEDPTSITFLEVRVFSEYWTRESFFVWFVLSKHELFSLFPKMLLQICTWCSSRSPWHSWCSSNLRRCVKYSKLHFIYKYSFSISQLCKIFANRIFSIKGASSTLWDRSLFHYILLWYPIRMSTMSPNLRTCFW